MDGEHSKSVRVVLAIYAALRDNRVDDMRAILDPEVVCYPLVRPGQPAYYGYEAMAKLAGYLHDQHGNYTVEIATITEQNAPKGNVKVTVEATIVPERGLGLAPVPVTSVYTVHDGVITWIVSKPGITGGR
jgi:hypothetical protein